MDEIRSSLMSEIQTIKKNATNVSELLKKLRVKEANESRLNDEMRALRNDNNTLYNFAENLIRDRNRLSERVKELERQLAVHGVGHDGGHDQSSAHSLASLDTTTTSATVSQSKVNVMAMALAIDNELSRQMGAHSRDGERSSVSLTDSDNSGNQSTKPFWHYFEKHLRCFNCSEVGHHIDNCKLSRNEEMIQRNMAKHKLKRERKVRLDLTDE